MRAVVVLVVLEETTIQFLPYRPAIRAVFVVVAELAETVVLPPRERAWGVVVPVVSVVLAQQPAVFGFGVFRNPAAALLPAHAPAGLQ